jgi:hypothetical protein
MINCVYKNSKLLSKKDLRRKKRGLRKIESSRRKLTKLKLMRKPVNSKKKRQMGNSRKLNLPEFKKIRMLENFG